MVRIAVLGATGRMGRLVIDAVVRADDLKLVAALTRAGSQAIGTDAGVLAGAGAVGVPIASASADALADCDVIIDFSSPDALGQILPLSGDIPLVSGTTGLGPDLLDALVERAHRGPVLVAANFSTGVTLLRDLVERAARALPDYDVEIVEAHHRFKRDAPSGTALALGQSAAAGRDWNHDEVAVHGREGQVGPRPEREIGYHAIRGGGIIGEHEVWLVGPGERIQLSHSAIHRATFADGAVRAARWIHGRAPGRYDLRDVLGLGR